MGQNFGWPAPIAHSATISSMDIRQLGSGLHTVLAGYAAGWCEPATRRSPFVQLQKKEEGRAADLHTQPPGLIRRCEAGFYILGGVAYGSTP